MLCIASRRLLCAASFDRYGSRLLCLFVATLVLYPVYVYTGRRLCMFVSRLGICRIDDITGFIPWKLQVYILAATLICSVILANVKDTNFLSEI
jgi:hypothetical protein